MSQQHTPDGQDSSHQASKFNQRASVRYQCAPATPGRVVLDPDKEFVRAWVMDLSVGGAGLLLPRPLQPGLAFVVHIRALASQKTYLLPARVVHSTSHSSGEWLVGCEFVKKLDGEELDELL